jgi:hypothetical protein
MKLQMSNGPTGVQNLPANDPTIVTGPMGDCVSVIVLYNLNGVKYQNAKGQHGLGGVEVVHFPTLLAGVPDVATTQVIVIPGILQQSNYASGNIRERVHNAVRTIAGLVNVNIRYVASCSNATVNRQGQLT